MYSQATPTTHPTVATQDRATPDRKSNTLKHRHLAGCTHSTGLHLFSKQATLDKPSLQCATSIEEQNMKHRAETYFARQLTPGLHWCTQLLCLAHTATTQVLQQLAACLAAAAYLVLLHAPVLRVCSSALHRSHRCRRCRLRGRSSLALMCRRCGCCICRASSCRCCCCSCCLCSSSGRAVRP